MPGIDTKGNFTVRLKPTAGCWANVGARTTSLAVNGRPPAYRQDGDDSLQAVECRASGESGGIEAGIRALPGAVV